MNKAELWARYCAKNPKFAGTPDEHVTQTVRGIKAFFDQTYDLAYKAGQDNPTNVFDGVFGKDR